MSETDQQDEHEDAHLDEGGNAETGGAQHERPGEQVHGVDGEDDVAEREGDVPETGLLPVTAGRIDAGLVRRKFARVRHTRRENPADHHGSREHNGAPEGDAEHDEIAHESGMHPASLTSESKTSRKGGGACLPMRRPPRDTLLTALVSMKGNRTMKYAQPVASVLAASALVALSACGGSSESKGGAGSSSSSSTETPQTSGGDVVASVGKTVTVPVSDTKLTVKKIDANPECPADGPAPEGQQYVSYDLEVSTDDPSNPIGLSGDWVAQTPDGDKKIEYIMGDMCQKPSDQFPLKFGDKKSFTHTKFFVVPKGTTAVKLTTTQLEGASLTLPLK